MRSLSIVAAIIATMAVCPPAQAQYFGDPHGNAHMYERGSHARWHMERDMMLGPMGSVRRALHGVRHVVDGVTHELRHLGGGFDPGYYDRWDRRSLGLGVPRPMPYGGMPYGGMPCGGMPGGGYVAPGYGMPVVNPMGMPMMGVPSIQMTGGARYPTTWDPRSRLFW